MHNVLTIRVRPIWASVVQRSLLCIQVVGASVADCAAQNRTRAAGCLLLVRQVPRGFVALDRRGAGCKLVHAAVMHLQWLMLCCSRGPAAAAAEWRRWFGEMQYSHGPYPCLKNVLIC